MCIQIVHHQSHLNGIGIALIKHLLDLMRPILPGAALSNRDMTPAGQRFDFHENFGDAVSDVFVIHPLRLSWLAGNWRMDFADQLLAGFVHAHHRVIGIIQQSDILRNFKCYMVLATYKEQWAGDCVFENEWQRFRTKKDRSLELTSVAHECLPGRRKIAVKVVDIFGNDTMTIVEVSV